MINNKANVNFNGTNIIFLELSDFINNTLSYKNKPVKGKWIVMVQGTFCGYCTQSKPDFIEVAKRGGDKVTFATIQIDGSESESQLGKKLPDITKVEIRGVPAYLIFDNGKFSGLYTGGRKESDLIEFLNL